jgi:hypothetical protein
MTAKQPVSETVAVTATEIKTADFAGMRLNREWETMKAMVRIHCRDRHAPVNGICVECQQLLDYANVRLERCRFGAEKPTCANCPVHCYERTRREQVKVVMRYAGPRMIWEHPVMSLRHWLDGFRKAPGIRIKKPPEEIERER